MGYIGDYIGDYSGLVNGDTRSLGYGSYGHMATPEVTRAPELYGFFVNHRWSSDPCRSYSLSSTKGVT